ncbi:MAG: serine/threonine-protein kinase [Acidobacteriia bacterium]|nr:serine/threonine-protein kinase [Terriglobia bacterium]
MTGQTISHYRILSKLGEGGMGVVYKAEDTKLRRAVALKFLSPQVAAEPEFRTRFLKEAQAAAALNHPNICTIFEIDEELGFLAMEFIEGESLTARTKARPLPLDEALDFAAQTAQGLQAAHEQGVVHRDIKSANLMVTAKGHLKVMDFGLAHISDRSRITKTGTSLGTPAYMSPEQAQGSPTDQRTDIWSLGVVLYEMLAGRLPFVRDVEAAMGHAVLTEAHAPVTSLRAGLPLAVDRILGKALAKDPADRYQHIDEMLVDLRGLRKPTTSAISLPAHKHRLLIVPAALGSAAVAAIAVWFALQLRTVPQPELVAFTLNTFGAEYSRPAGLSLSPDGGTLAFVATDTKGQRLVWLRSLRSLQSQPIAGTDGAASPFWSPDGNFLGFTSKGKLRKITVTGGIAQEIADSPGPRGGAWNSDGDILFQVNSRFPLSRVKASGGPVALATRMDEKRQENSHRNPQFLPGGRDFLFNARASAGNSSIYVGRLGTLDSRRIIAANSSAAYAPPQPGHPGYLLYAREGTLLAHPFDPGKAELTGDPLPVVDQVQQGSTGGHAEFSVSADGRVLAWQQAEAGNVQLVWLDRTGNRIGNVGPQGEVIEPRISPDGEKVIFSQPDPRSGNRDLWWMDLATQAVQRLTLDPNNDWQPVWSPDGARVLFSTDRIAGVGSIAIGMFAGSGNQAEFPVKGNTTPIDWSWDGRYLMYVKDDSTNVRKLWILPLHGDRKPIPFAQSGFVEPDAKFSPDGRWIAYTSNKSGRFEVYVRSMPAALLGDEAAAGERQVSVNGGGGPRWRRDGKELFFHTPDGMLQSVDVKGTGAWQAASPRPLFKTCGGFWTAYWQNNYDVTADGKRFLFSCALPPASGEENSTRIHVMINWTSKLKRP